MERKEDEERKRLDIHRTLRKREGGQIRESGSERNGR